MTGIDSSEEDGESKENVTIPKEKVKMLTQLLQGWVVCLIDEAPEIFQEGNLFRKVTATEKNTARKSGFFRLTVLVIPWFPWGAPGSLSFTL